MSIFKEVKNLRKLLFFHASWCSPCKKFEREVISPLEKIVGTGCVERIDAWKEPQRAEKYQVDKLPTVILLDGDTVYLKHTGAIEISEVAAWLKRG